MDFEIIPFERVGLIYFGMTPEEVRQAIDLDFEWVAGFDEKQKTASDSSGDNGLLISYLKVKELYLCAWITFWYPANPIFKGKSLIKQTGRGKRSIVFEIEKWLMNFDKNFNIYEGEILEIMFQDLGVSLSDRFDSGAYITVYGKEIFTMVDNDNFNNYPDWLVAKAQEKS